MKLISQLCLFSLLTLVISSCQTNNDQFEVQIKNSLEIDRTNETVVLHYSDFSSQENIDYSSYGIFDQKNGEECLFQHIDLDNNGVNDAILFQPNVKANAVQSYIFRKHSGNAMTESKVYSRFVPERTDDYAWENDKVAFRTYGPTAQKMAEDGIKGGTLSSGIDCWLKKVDYSIIDKWYEKHTTGKGSYHEDTGEGLDNFHVGTSRGCGGIGVYLNDELYTSKNFTAYNTLANGPIRTEFTLDYADWDAKGLIISEQKKISLDLGSNFMNVIAKVKGVETISVGLTLHENDGETKVDEENGWFSYWQPHADSELGTAIVIDLKYYQGFTKVESEEKDKSQLLVHLKVIGGQVEYKAGFYWKESKQFNSKVAWEKHLTEFAKVNQEPLEVKIIQ